MVTVQEGPIARYRCHTGHAFTAGVLAELGLPRIENSLHAALAQLEELEVLLRELQQSAAAKGDDSQVALCARRVDELRGLAERLRDIILDPALSPATLPAHSGTPNVQPAGSGRV